MTRRAAAAKPTAATTSVKPRAAATAARPPMTSGELSVKRYIARQPEELRPILNEVRALVRQVAPDATVDRRWGSLVCEIRGQKLCTIKLASRRKEAAYLVFDPIGNYPDPEELLLEHAWIGGCYLELRPEVELPRATILGCLRFAVRRARRRIRANP